MYENLKRILGAPTDVVMAEELGIKPTAFANQKQRGTIPIKEVIEFCRGKKFSLDQIFGLQPIPESAMTSDHVICFSFRALRYNLLTFRG